MGYCEDDDLPLVERDELAEEVEGLAAEADNLHAEVRALRRQRDNEDFEAACERWRRENLHGGQPAPVPDEQPAYLKKRLAETAENNRRIREGEPPPPARGHKDWSFISEWAENPFITKPPPRDWVVKHLLEAGTAGMLCGPGGIGKSFSELQLGISVATGRSWLDTYAVATTGKVAILLGEETPQEVHRRLYRIGQQLGLTPREHQQIGANLMVRGLSGESSRIHRVDRKTGNDEPTKFLEDLYRFLRNHEWRLIILDPLARFACADAELDAGSGTGFVERIEEMARLIPGRPAVLVSHHTTKASREGGEARANAARGTSALSDGFRWQAQLTGYEGRPNFVSFTITKCNNSQPVPPLTLIRGDGGALTPASPEQLAHLTGTARAREAKK